VIEHILFVDKEKFKKMMCHKSSKKSNVLHLLAIMHYKKIMRYMNIHFESFIDALKVKNSDGLFPIDLYNKHKIKNILEHEK
jgi:hypothetical protein